MILVITFVYHYALHMHLDIVSCPLSTVLLTSVWITSSFDDLWTNINNILFRHILQRISRVFSFDKWDRVIKRLVLQLLKDWKSLPGWPFKIYIDQNQQIHPQPEIRKIMKLIRGKFMVSTINIPRLVSEKFSANIYNLVREKREINPKIDSIQCIGWLPLLRRKIWLQQRSWIVC